MKEDYKAMKQHSLSNCFWVLVLKNTSKIKQFNNKGTVG
jgi:hypothetical protein